MQWTPLSFLIKSLFGWDISAELKWKEVLNNVIGCDVTVNNRATRSNFWSNTGESFFLQARDVIYIFSHTYTENAMLRQFIALTEEQGKKEFALYLNWPVDQKKVTQTRRCTLICTGVRSAPHANKPNVNEISTLLRNSTACSYGTRF